jgi:REP element-mobilizing transposase RayT
MVRGIEKRRIIDDETDRRNFVRRLGALAEETRTPIYAWALMSNHVHILLCSEAWGLAKFMRRFLIGYAVSYNLRHRRHGHVFQNRYKSIVCDGDSYFTELVRQQRPSPPRPSLPPVFDGLKVEDVDEPRNASGSQRYSSTDFHFSSIFFLNSGLIAFTGGN